MRCTQSDFLLHVKRWMLKFELTHNCTLSVYNHSSSSQHGLRVPGGGVYVHFRVGDVTNPGGMSCSPYQPFVVVCFF